MDHFKSKSSSSSGFPPCGRCHESRELELQARSILGFGTHSCCCNLGRHEQQLQEEQQQQHLEIFRSSKRPRTSANGRFVPVVDSASSALISSSSLIPGLGDDEARLCLARLNRSYYGQLFSVSRRFCSLLRSGELYRTRSGLGIWEQWVYVLISGQSAWRAFLLADTSPLVRWRPLPPTPSDPCFCYADKESLTAGTQLLVVGREAVGHCIWGYDLVSDRWFRAPQMITPRCLYASASCGSHAFVAGGIDTALSPLSTAERYDSASGRWEALPEMSSKRKMCSGFYMDEKFYVVGGVVSDGQGKESGLSSGEEYDPEVGSWRRIENMWPVRGGAESNTSAPPLVAVVENELFSLDTTTRQLMKYCKGSNRWTDLGDVPVKPDASSGWGVAFKAVNGELLLIGGAIYACKPSGEGPVNWRLVAGLIPPGTFIFNCAVMSA